MRRYTTEEKIFLKEYIPGHFREEIVNAFNERFDEKITLKQVTSFIKNNHIYTGKKGNEGRAPWNKGEKYCAGGRSKETQYKKGHCPVNWRPIGSERINADGYVEIKIADPNKWCLKHRYIWQNAYGSIPNGYIVTFRDSNPLNCEIDNLMLISRAVNLKMNQHRFHDLPDVLKETSVNVSELMIEIGKKRGYK